MPSWGAEGYVTDFGDVSTEIGEDICGESLKHVTKNGWDKNADDIAWRFLMLCTGGNYDQLEYDVGAHNIRNATEGITAMQFFVKDPPSRDAVYASGRKPFGNKSDVIDALLKGYDMSVVFANEQPTRMDNLNISDSGEVSGQNIWQISAVKKRDHFEFISDSDWGYSLYSTNSYYDISVWKMGEHDYVNRISGYGTLKWFADSCWRHVYTNDENGKRVSGSLDQLTTAVDSGHRVKVIIGNYSIEADNVMTFRGRVIAQTLNEVTKEDAQHLKDDLAWVWKMVHTTGTVRTRSYLVGSATNAGDATEQKTISWFIDTRPWKMVLSQARNGRVKSGSKAELRNAVKNGASVRVAIKACGCNRFSRGGAWRGCKGWFVIGANDVELGPSGDVAAQAVTSVGAEEAGSTDCKIKDDPYRRFMVISTKGGVDIARWRVGQHTSDGHVTEHAKVNWFVSQ